MKPSYSRWTRASRRMAIAVALVITSMFHVTVADAWGNIGHRLVARVADAHLTPTAKSKVRALLKSDPSGHTLRDVAVWADSVKLDPRDGLDNTRQWHFVDIPRKETSYDAARDCKATKEGDCILQALERQRAILANTHASKTKRSEALKFIVHLVGDLHQPLHCSNDNDRGGNNTRVQFNGFATNLHSLWDLDMIHAAANADHLTEVAYAKRLLSALPADVSAMQAGTAEDWALEAHHLADTNAYDIPAATGTPKVHRLPPAYFATNRPVMEDQLAKGGVRLAGVLNAILK